MGAKMFRVCFGSINNGVEPLHLLNQSKATTASLAFQQMVRSYAESICNQQSVAPLNANVHPDDQMLLHSLGHHQNSDVALSQYYAISLQQFYAAHQIIKKFFDPSDRSLKILDFACGYGRLLRLLTTQIPAQRIWASEIQTDAVAYVAEQFGVHGLQSFAKPTEFLPERISPGVESTDKFDFIWVASLFSHLPEPLFHGWMQKLISLLTPRGVLCFSIRDQALLSPEKTMPQSGILYFGISEITPLADEIYGTTYVSENFVKGAIERATKPAQPYFRLAKSLAHEQDLYVVARNGDTSLERLSDFRRGAWGWADLCTLSNDGLLHLEGWAASLDDGVLDDVIVLINGSTLPCVTGLSRADVATVFGDPRLKNAGWTFTHVLAETPQQVRICVEARSRAGERALLFSGNVFASDKTLLLNNENDIA